MDWEQRVWAESSIFLHMVLLTRLFFTKKSQAIPKKRYETENKEIELKSKPKDIVHKIEFKSDLIKGKFHKT